MSSRSHTGKTSPRHAAAVLARLVQRTGGLARSIGGSIGLFVPGPDGGRWRLDLETGRLETLDANTASEVDTLICASPRAACALWLSPRDVADYARSGELKVLGDRTKLASLAAILDRGRSTVSVRM